MRMDVEIGNREKMGMGQWEQSAVMGMGMGMTLRK